MFYVLRVYFLTLGGMHSMLRAFHALGIMNTASFLISIFETLETVTPRRKSESSYGEARRGRRPCLFGLMKL